MEIYTSTHSYSGPDRLDVTVQTGDLVFAPTWPIVRAFKGLKIGESTYTKRYSNLMWESWNKNNARWREVLGQDRIVLTCYCPPGQFCHRLLLAHILVQRAKELNISAKYLGEI